MLRLRIRRAVELLQEGDVTVSEAAAAVGFKDSNYFTRQFSKIMGHPPRDIRPPSLPRR